MEKLYILWFAGALKGLSGDRRPARSRLLRRFRHRWRRWCPPPADCRSAAIHAGGCKVIEFHPQREEPVLGILKSVSRFGKRGFICLGLLALFTANCFAKGSIGLAWDPNPEPEVTGYVVYFGVASGRYTNRVDVGKVTTHTVADLVGNADYFFAVTAYNSSRLESAYSNEISYRLPSTGLRLTITAENKSRTYGGTNPALTAAYSGFVNGDTAPVLDSPVILSTTATAGSPVGNYPIIASGATDANYTISYVVGTLTINPAPLAIKAQNKSKTYGAVNPALTAIYAGFVNGDTAAVLDRPVILSTSATTGSPVGNYPILTSGAADANYTISQLAGTLVVGGAPFLTETVAWQNVVGAKVGSRVLTKTAGAGWANAGACSTIGIEAGGDGYAEFTVPADGGYVLFGLSNGDTGPSAADVDYAFYPSPGQGLLIIWEKGIYIGTYGTFSPGNKLKISVQADVVQYWREGVLLRTSTSAPTYPLRVDTSLYSTGASIPAVTLAAPKFVNVVPPLPTEMVAWQNVVGSSVGQGVLTKTAGPGWANAGASSTRGIAAGSDGYAEFTVPADGSYAFFGLSSGDTGQSAADIDYAFYPRPGQDLLMIYEKGVYVGSFGAFAPGNKLALSAQGDVVQYWRDGELLYTSASVPAYPLRVDTSLYSTGATIPAVTLAGTELVSVVPVVPTEAVAWQNVVGASVVSGMLTKTAGPSWANAGASSTRGITFGSDGYAEFTVPADGGYAFFGLSHGDDGPSAADVDYAFYPHPGQGKLIIYEKGGYIGSFGAVAPGDKLTISVEADVVQYWRDGVLLRTSTSAPTYPLRVDTSLYSTGATIPAVTLGGFRLIDNP